MSASVADRQVDPAHGTRGDSSDPSPVVDERPKPRAVGHPQRRAAASPPTPGTHRRPSIGPGATRRAPGLQSVAVPVTSLVPPSPVVTMTSRPATRA